MEAVAVKQQAHTPGPWRSAMATSVDGPAPFDDSLVVATELKTEGIHDTICVVSPRGTLRARDKANAALIAAAPELLTALIDCANRLEKCALHGGSDKEAVAALMSNFRPIIAKAIS